MNTLIYVVASVGIGTSIGLIVCTLWFFKRITERG